VNIPKIIYRTALMLSQKKQIADSDWQMANGQPPSAISH
jgi:hypothetical protein